MESNKAVQAGIYSGLIDKNSISLEQYRPRLLINDASKGQKVLTSLISEQGDQLAYKKLSEEGLAAIKKHGRSLF